MNEADVTYVSYLKILVDDIRNNDAQNLIRLKNNFSFFSRKKKLRITLVTPWIWLSQKKHHSIVESLSVDTINTLYVHRNVNFHFNFTNAKVERKLIKFRKKNSSFPDKLRKNLTRSYL